MDNRYKYQKSFLIFEEEDNGFGTEQKPSGHVKIEIRDGKGKLYCQVSNLVEDSGNVEYRLFLIKADEMIVVPVLVGAFVLKRNRGELEWNFDSYNVDKTGIAFDRFNVFAVLTNQKDGRGNSVLCPLAAYKNGKVEWRQKLNSVLIEKTNEEVLNINQKDVDIINNKSCEKVEINSDKKEENTENSSPVEKNQSADSGKENEFVEAKEPNEEQKGEPVTPNIKEHIDENTTNSQEKSNAEGQEEEKSAKNKENSKSYSSYDGTKLFEMFSEESKDDTNSDPNLKANLNTNCLNCIFFNNKSTDKLDIKDFGFEEWSKQFDLTFERYSPFSVKRTDYNWWKVVSPVHLNNILCKFGIKIPVLFNPLVLMAHYKYKHLIVGIYKNEKQNKDYIVCGIPGVYWVDEKPFGNACRWAQVEGNTTTYGAFGYWIVYINPKTGKILAVEE